MTYLPQIDDFDTKMALLKTLLDISDGKVAFPLFFYLQMFLEKERAQLIREVMRMKESRGDVEGAAAASQEIQVEVCNALSSREKAEFLLEQVLTPESSSCVDPPEPAGARLGARAADHPEGEREGAEGGAHGRTAHRPTSP